MAAGYSSTPLAKKLGLADGQVAGFVGLPDDLAYLANERDFASVETRATWSELGKGPFAYLQLFTDQKSILADAIPALRDRLTAAGMLWVSWPKKASKVPTDMTEDVIRDTALVHRMVDIKVCAVNEIWSGLKLVIRKSHRATHMNA